MKKQLLKVKSNTSLAEGVYRMELEAPEAGLNVRPGQFINIKIDGCYLRRPISVSDAQCDVITIVFKAVGRGTDILASLSDGAELEALTGLGNGFDLSLCGRKPLLVCGGIGTAPMYYLAKELIKQGVMPGIAMGFNKAGEIFYKEEFEALGCRVAIATADGSAGVKGFVTDVMRSLDYDYIYTCGPEPMLKAVFKECKTSGQFSFEERMGCGFGACMGCSCKTVTGYKRICKDGPVLCREEILWED